MDLRDLTNMGPLAEYITLLPVKTSLRDSLQTILTRDLLTACSHHSLASTTSYFDLVAMSDNDQTIYKLPYKDEERNRLNIQHMMWTALFGGLFPAELTPIVERRMGLSKPMVMDVGCGTGIWALEMATRFPQAGVLAIDIVVPSISSPVPSNLRFKQLDLAKSIPDEYTGQFDIVHCRTVAVHMEDPPKLVNDLVRCLKPGGLIIIPDVVVECLDEDGKPLTPFLYDPEIDIPENIANARKLSGLGGHMAFLDKAMRKPKHQPANVMLKNTGVVEDIRFQEFLSPIGWAGKGISRGEKVGALLRSNVKNLFDTSSEMMIAQGVPGAVVDALTERAIAELEERRCIVWTCASARAFEKPSSKL